MMNTDWKSLLSTKQNVAAVSNFAAGSTTGKQFLSSFTNTPNSGTVRTLLRERGVTGARSLAKKALSRR
jgi:hypothetical protein|tara:strand:- start:292 stop:498 length:207 start_codon:yes stop_codon:yes gene_type:complete